MRRKIFIILSAIVLFWGVSKLSFTQVHSEHEHGVAEDTEEAVSEEAANVGNKICPVSGEKIGEETKVTYEHEGKIYNFCCQSCIEEFKKDPEEYIKKVDEELQAESESTSEHEGHEMEMMQGQVSETMHQEMHKGGHH